MPKRTKKPKSKLLRKEARAAYLYLIPAFIGLIVLTYIPLIAVFGLAHIFLGAGIFQPYRGTAKLMFGDGTVSESDALYHWGHWARKEIATGENVVEKAK